MQKISQFLFLLLFVPIDIFATSWAVGTLAENGSPGLSIQRRADDLNAIHASAHYTDNEDFNYNIDYQRFFYEIFKQFTSEKTLGLYIGTGIRAESHVSAKEKEFYYLRAPIGIEYMASSINLQVFSDLSMVLDPNGGKGLQSLARIGFRGYF